MIESTESLSSSSTTSTSSDVEADDDNGDDEEEEDGNNNNNQDKEDDEDNPMTGVSRQDRMIQALQITTHTLRQRQNALSQEHLFLQSAMTHNDFLVKGIETYKEQHKVSLASLLVKAFVYATECPPRYLETGFDVNLEQDIAIPILK